MYKAYFNLARNPFDLTPDPVCFVPTKRHSEALAALYYGVRWHKGFVVVTGEVGTGKTLLLRCLLRLLKESNDVALAYVFNSRLSSTEFLQYVLADFGLHAGDKKKWELLFTFGNFLAEQNQKRVTTVLIVDEAHHLSPGVLEEIRLLSNLETADDKLLQIVMVGQPELDVKLDSPDLRQLKQRIALRAQLRSLDRSETQEYITQRMLIAGANPDLPPVFPQETIAVVQKFSRGLPRMINTICENSLLAAYAAQQKTVTPQIVEDVAREFRLDRVQSRDAERRATELDFADLFGESSSLRKGLEENPGQGEELPEEIAKHEPYI
jgi:general secretion pathway protein A